MWWHGGLKGRMEGVKDTVNKTKKSHKSHQPLSLPFFFSLFSFPPLSKLSFLSSLQPAACTCGLYEYINTLFMHWTCAHPHATPAKSNTTPFSIHRLSFISKLSFVLFFPQQSSLFDNHTILSRYTHKSTFIHHNCNIIQRDI